MPCDDVVHLRTDPRTGRLQVWGSPWFLRLLPEAVNLFPELGGLQPRLRSDHEWYLEIETERFGHRNQQQLSLWLTQSLFAATCEMPL